MNYSKSNRRISQFKGVRVPNNDRLWVLYDSWYGELLPTEEYPTEEEAAHAFDSFLMSKNPRYYFHLNFPENFTKPEHLVCKGCTQSFPITAEYWAWLKEVPTSFCKKCRRIKFNKTTIEHNKIYGVSIPHAKISDLYSYFKYSLWSVRRRAEKSKKEFSLTPEFLANLFKEQKGKCAISGLLMTLDRGNSNNDQVSIDRIDSSKGYSKDNTQLVRLDVNWAKNKLSDTQFIRLSEDIIANNYDKAHFLQLKIMIRQQEKLRDKTVKDDRVWIRKDGESEWVLDE